MPPRQALCSRKASSVTQHRHIRSARLAAVKLQSLYVASAVGLALTAHAQPFGGGDIPSSLAVPAGEAVLLKVHATGWQIYTCGVGDDQKPKWTLKAPDADLHDAGGKVIGHHSAGPTWKLTDGSEVVGKAVAHVDAPDKKSVPWLLLSATSHSGNGKLAAVTSIQRLHTEGGQPPAMAECSATKADTEARAAYSADYYFYGPK
jgi:hypothetical protein